MRIALILIALACGGSPALAHVNMLLPSAATAKKGQEVVFTYQWGHPYEHQLFDAPKPTRVVVMPPQPITNGGAEVIDLTEKLEKGSVPSAERKHVTVWQFRFTPDHRGDYVFLLTTPPILLAEEEHFVQDTVKVVLHVQAQNGWDAAVPKAAMQFVPLTRPYGLKPNAVVQLRLPEAKDADWAVEIERYNDRSPKELPPDEEITAVAKTDPNGVVTGTVDAPGWWSFTAHKPRDKDTVTREGRSLPLRRRAIFWLYVDGQSGPK